MKTSVSSAVAALVFTLAAATSHAGPPRGGALGGMHGLGIQGGGWGIQGGGHGIQGGGFSGIQGGGHVMGEYINKN